MVVSVAKCGAHMRKFLFSQADSERTETSALKRENQSLVESCDSLEKSRQKVTHDLGVKEQQVSPRCNK